MIQRKLGQHSPFRCFEGDQLFWVFNQISFGHGLIRRNLIITKYDSKKIRTYYDSNKILTQLIKKNTIRTKNDSKKIRTLLIVTPAGYFIAFFTQQVSKQNSLLKNKNKNHLVCFSVLLSFCLSVFLSFCLSVFLSFYLSVFLSIL